MTLRKEVIAMNKNLLLSIFKRNGVVIKHFCEEELKVSPSSFYKKIKGASQFSREEIIVISKYLNLSNEEILNIFFNEVVSFKTHSKGLL